MSRGPRVRIRTFVVVRIAWPSERARDERVASLEVQAETPELAALACARFIGARCAPLQLEVAGILYRATRNEPAARTFPPSARCWTISNQATGESQCFNES